MLRFLLALVLVVAAPVVAVGLAFGFEPAPIVGATLVVLGVTAAAIAFDASGHVRHDSADGRRISEAAP